MDTYYCCHGHENNQIYRILKTQTRTKACLFYTNKNKNTTHGIQNPTRFYGKKETKIEQGYDKKTYSKLMLKKLKFFGNSISIYTYWTPSSIFLKNQPTRGPCALMCTHV